jgi:hypothetical protein
LLSIISGLLLSVAIDEVVFRLSVEIDVGGRGGDVTDSFGADVFRDSHENGLVSFLPGAASAGSFDVAGPEGGGDHGTEGSAPDNPMSEDVRDDLGGSGAFFSGSIIGTESQLLVPHTLTAKP